MKAMIMTINPAPDKKYRIFLFFILFHLNAKLTIMFQASKCAGCWMLGTGCWLRNKHLAPSNKHLAPKINIHLKPLVHTIL
jgi:hypothetical protein